MLDEGENGEIGFGGKNCEFFWFNLFSFIYN